MASGGGEGVGWACSEAQNAGGLNEDGGGTDVTIIAHTFEQLPRDLKPLNSPHPKNPKPQNPQT